MIKNIIFDIGNVIFNYDPVKIINTVLPHTNSKDKHLKCLMEGPIWDELDSGRLQKESAFELLQSDYNYSNDEVEEANQLIDNFNLHLDLDIEMKSLFEKLAAEFNVYIISNFQSQPFQALLSRHPFLSKAKKIVISADVKLLKPNPRIYHYLINGESLDPTETVFIDDRKENVKAANKQRINGIIHKNVSETIEALQSEFEITI